MDVYQRGLRTLQRLRTGGQQVVTVQRVSLAPGAEAVIGNGQAEGRSASGEEPKLE